MLPAVIKKIHEAKVNNQETLDIWGDGEARREFMYDQDLADFTYFALENFEKMSPIALFTDFYSMQNNNKQPSEKQLQVIQALISGEEI